MSRHPERGGWNLVAEALDGFLFVLVRLEHRQQLGDGEQILDLLSQVKKLEAMKSNRIKMITDLKKEYTRIGMDMRFSKATKKKTLKPMIDRMTKRTAA